jgi:hypothetical protein
MDNNDLLETLKSILILEKRNPYHDPGGANGGQFTHKPGGAGGKVGAGESKPARSAGTSAGKPTAPTMSAAASAKLKAELDSAGGPKRDMDKKKVAGAYHSDNAITDPFYKTSELDGGVYYSGVWNKAEKPPSGYEASMPKAPRVSTIKEGDFSSKSTWKPPMSMTDIDGLRSKGPAGVYAARVMLNDLYAHAAKRQGAAVEVHAFNSAGQSKFMKENGLSTINWEWHHNISSGKGGSNSGKNMSLLNGGEHTVAHMLEAVINPIKTSKGTKPGNLGVYPQIEVATAARAQNNVTKQLGSQAGRLRNAKYGKEGTKPLSASEFKKLEITVNQQVKPYMDIAISAGVYEPNSKLLFDRKGVVYFKPNAINVIRGHLAKNPLEPKKR